MTFEEEFPPHVMPTFAFYRDVYGGTLDAALFVEAKPAAERCVCHLCLSAAVVEDFVDERDRVAWCRAVCAAAEAFAEFGEGRVGGYSIGDFKVTNCMERGTTGLEVAQKAALMELAGTGLVYTWAGRP